MSSTRAKVVIAFGVGLLLLVATACGSSSNSGASGSASGQGPVTVATNCPISGAEAAPECASAVKAAFDEINANGGINGHKLVDISCDNQALPAPYVSCERQLTSKSDVVAFVGNGGTNGPLPTDIAMIGSTINDTEELTNHTVFAFSSNAQGGDDNTVSILYAKSHGLTRPGVVVCELAVCLQVATALHTDWRGTKLTSVTSDLANVSLAPQMTLLKHDGVNVVHFVEATSGVIGGLKAATSINYQPMFAMPENALDANVFSQVPSGATTVILPTPYNVTPSTLGPIESAMNKYVGTGKWRLDSYMLTSWLAAQVFAADLKTIHGQVTRSSVLSAMSKVTDFSDPLLASSIDFSKPGPITKQPSVHVAQWYADKILNGKLVPTSKPIDIANAMNASG